MYKTDKVELKDIEYVLDNLSDLTKYELEFAFGANFKKEVLARLNCAVEKQLIKLKSNNEVVGVFGLIEEKKDVAGIFFLTTKNLYKGNMTKLLRTAKEVIKEWLTRYKLLLDDCFVENTKIVKLLHYLGFRVCPNEENEKIKTFYKGQLNV